MINATEEYVKQCEKAEKLQKDHEEQMGDFIARNTALYVRVGRDETGEITEEYLKLLGFDCYDRSDGIVVFRYDQLQDMIRREGADDLGYIADFYHFWVNGELDKYFIVRPKSIEDVLLRYVMKEKYCEVWDGKNWIKEDEIEKNNTPKV